MTRNWQNIFQSGQGMSETAVAQLSGIEVDLATLMAGPGAGAVSAASDVTLSSDTDASGAGDIVFKTGGVQRARIRAGGEFDIDYYAKLRSTSTLGVPIRHSNLLFSNNDDGGGDTLKWEVGLDNFFSNHDTFAISRGYTGGEVDVVLLKDYGTDVDAAHVDVAIGLNPNGDPGHARVFIGGIVSQNIPSLWINVRNGMTAPALQVYNSDGAAVKFSINADGSIAGMATVVSSGGTPNRVLRFVNSNGTGDYGWEFNGTRLEFWNRYGTPVGSFGVNTDGSLLMIGAFNAGNVTSTFNNINMTAGYLKWATATREQTTVGAAGAASALPATPTKYLQVKDSTGAVLVIPAYLAA